jgi:hypothetical protein
MSARVWKERKGSSNEKGFFDADVPLNTGPLAPLVTPRVVFDAAAEWRLGERWGADPETGHFRCPVPGHRGLARLGVVDEDPDRDLRLLCCRGCWRSLGEVRAAEGYGQDSRRRSQTELAAWTRRLASEVGAFQPAVVEVPRLSASAPPHVHLARDGFASLLGHRWADFPPRPVAYSVRFCVAWCGLPKNAAGNALRQLREQDVLRIVGSIGSCPLYWPGRGQLSEDEVVAWLKAEVDAVELLDGDRRRDTVSVAPLAPSCAPSVEPANGRRRGRTR